ncbi:MAG: cytosine/creatinine deaminase [Alphaproteobacteria bacterium]|nr:cytosine/creatinine deaminase [Alphaproteobacteria bacterium]
MPNEVTIGSVALPGRSGAYSVTLRDGLIAAVRPAEQPGAAARFALPGLVNLHAHADRAYTVESFRPRSFADALAAAGSARAAFTAADVQARATRLLERSVGHGVIRIRTHTDVDPIVELRSMEGVLAAKQAMAGKIDVDIIAFSTSKNDLADPYAVLRLKDAVDMGAGLIGASLNSSADPPRALVALLDMAEHTRLPVDIHLDEHLEPHQMLAGMVADAVIARGLQGLVTLSHLCVLSALNSKIAGELIKKLARAEVTVVALPETNLFLQDRGESSPIRRGVTLVRELLAAGVKVRLGTDNVRDWFFPFGDADMLDTGLFAAVAAHLDDEADLIAALCDGRNTIEEGDPADLVLLKASSFDDALARRPAERTVFKAGRQVAGPARG